MYYSWYYLNGIEKHAKNSVGKKKLTLRKPFSVTTEEINVGKLTCNQHEHSKNVTLLGKEIIFSKKKEPSPHPCPQIQVCQKESLVSMEYTISELYSYIDLIFSSSAHL